ncbi:hypothetical protein F6X53_14725 [Methylobacterium soli]|uniref:Uncharacterized protein n=2 Tax=Methylobacterium soli TaxID=553447 RepID=A0A6L3T0Z6_9HYPH|nr:hypothetical protein F6X53_14725 [Methylobacterium soli]
MRSLVAGNALRLSERNRRFLSFVVDETLAGRAGRIKAYAIGVDVFGRGSDFDPGTDPIVRIEATRIRTALAAYYEGAGAQDAIRVLLRPGSYIPEFEFARAASPALPPGADTGGPQADQRAAARTALVVTHRTDRRDRCAVATGELYLQAVVRAAAGQGFRVFVTPPPARRAAAQAIRALLHHPEDVYALDLAVFGIAEGRRCAWSLCDLRSGEFLGSDFVDLVGGEPPEAAGIDRQAASVARRVADAVA